MFTRDAKREAQRNGAPPIDLIDGNILAKQLKELELGVDVQIKEEGTLKLTRQSPNVVDRLKMLPLD